MRTINKIIVHCSYTPKEMDIGVKEIKDWHVGNGWSDIGYHYVIRRDGTVEEGRPVSIAGAHVKGHNQDSIGICLVGGKGDNGKPQFNYTHQQLLELQLWIMCTAYKYNLSPSGLYGHYEFNDNKECPCFDVKEWYFG